MKNNFCIALLLLLAISAAIPESAYSWQEDLQTVFNKMRTARRTISYEGEIKLVYFRERGDRTINKKITAKPPRDFNEELILTPEEKKRLEEFRERRLKDMPESRRRRFEDMSERFRSGSNSLNDFANTRINVELLRQNYEIVFEDGADIAGKKTYFISIMPKYELRVGNKIWVDKETGIVLKRESFQPQNLDKPFFAEEFTKIEYGAVVEPQSRRSQRDRTEQVNRSRRSGNQRSRRHDTKEFKTLEEIPERARQRIVTPAELPPGFVLDNVRITRERDHVTIMQIYTDGLIMFTLTQMRGELPDQFRNNIRDSRQNQRRHGGRVVLFKAVDRNNFIIVGYASQELLQAVLDSIPEK
ncbi:sigma-E factor regulatory protein RseB domain-containing protein [candidate division KSB1 bacterium]